ncbi:hypothetical protein RJT34_04417 [Clitoria ternatea]|uniref:Uncharacterized protein n=1 Tax=Clitoria ternatea TaxID=43366 RepID=A0AAN9KLJ5_CLITE
MKPLLPPTEECLASLRASFCLLNLRSSLRLKTPFSIRVRRTFAPSSQRDLDQNFQLNKQLFVRKAKWRTVYGNRTEGKQRSVGFPVSVTSTTLHVCWLLIEVIFLPSPNGIGSFSSDQLILAEFSLV